MLNDTRRASAYRYIGRFEGTRLRMYKCPAGYQTIGVGHNLETNPITLEAALQIFRDDIDICVRDLIEVFAHWEKVGWARQLALVDIRFNLGPTGFRVFENMIQAVKDEDWEEAGLQLLYRDPHIKGRVHSKYYFDVKGRAVMNARVLREEVLEQYE